MSALDRYVVLVPGLSGPVHVYACSREDAMREGANSIGLPSLPEGSTAIPVRNELEVKWESAA